ncbi:helix-turn-helix domain-containing protein [Stenotrophomonas maltophilia]|nr:helix-turn-helix domain-containing protein [Stenotrophomonas maltophilia]
MSIVSTLIDKARQRAGIASDSALAAQFGVHRQAVSKWRNGDAYPDEEHIAEMAVMAGDDPVQWLVAIKAIRAEGKAGKAWAALAKRLATAAMVVLLAVGFTLPRDVQAMPQAGNALHDIHYAKCRIWPDTVRGLRVAMAPALAW